MYCLYPFVKGSPLHTPCPEPAEGLHIARLGALLLRELAGLSQFSQGHLGQSCFDPLSNASFAFHRHPGVENMGCWRGQTPIINLHDKGIIGVCTPKYCFG